MLNIITIVVSILVAQFAGVAIMMALLKNKSFMKWMCKWVMDYMKVCEEVVEEAEEEA